MVLTHRHLIEALVSILICQVITLCWRALLQYQNDNFMPANLPLPEPEPAQVNLELHRDKIYQVVVENNNVLYSQGPYYTIKSEAETYLVVDWLTDGNLDVKQFDISEHVNFNFDSSHFFIIDNEIYAWGLDANNQITIFQTQGQKLRYKTTVTFQCNLASITGKYLVCTEKSHSVIYRLNDLTVSYTINQVATNWESIDDILIAKTYLEIIPAGGITSQSYSSLIYYQFNPDKPGFNVFIPDIIPYQACEVSLGGLIAPIHYDKCKHEITTNHQNLPAGSELLFIHGNGINGRLYLK